MRPAIARAVLVGAALIGSTPASESGERPPRQVEEIVAMKGQPDSSRPPPPDVRPVEHKGVRYEQDLDSSAQGGLGGFLVAKDAGTGRVLWRLKVYDVADESAAGVDRIGLYFQRMTLVPDRDELMIEDEASRRFRVDLDTRTVTEIAEPAEAPAAPAPAKPRPPQ